MNNAEIKQEIWRRVYSVAVAIDPILLVGMAVVENDGRPLSKSESKQAQNQYRKILKEIIKKYKGT